MAQVLAWLDWDWAAADVELKRAQRALRVAAIFIFLSLVVFAKFHEPTRFAYTLQKLAHPVTFGAVALLFLTLLRRQTPRRFGSYVVASLTVLCGAGTEAAQAFVDRGPSLLDVLRDALGALRHSRGSQRLPGRGCRSRLTRTWRMRQRSIEDSKEVFAPDLRDVFLAKAAGELRRESGSSRGSCETPVGNSRGFWCI
jgi:hypothetical protein